MPINQKHIMASQKMVMSLFTGVRSPVLSCLTELSKSLNTVLLKSTMHEKYTYISLGLEIH